MNDITSEITNAVPVLEEGGIIVYPTDTVWGIGCDATSLTAVEKIMSLKGKREDKGYIVMMESLAMVENYVTTVPESIKAALLDPHPTSVIVPNPTGLLIGVLAVDGTLAVRIPKDPICLGLMKGLGKPLVSTSANFTGHPLPTQFSEISMELLDGVDYVINLRQEAPLGGEPSRLVRIAETGKMIILRN